MVEAILMSKTVSTNFVDTILRSKTFFTNFVEIT